MSVEEPAASEEAKDSEAKKQADEDQKKTDDKEDEAAEESKVEAMDTSVPDEIKKEESTNGKLKWSNVCHLSFQIYVKVCSLIPVFPC